jgi:two-component system, chemotaxis family, response regulator Rcp1
VHILVVEDNKADAHLVRVALRDELWHRVSIVEDGVQAMAFLRREGPYAQAARTDLVLLDLNLPHKDGRAVLAECKADPAFRHIPVVILTSSRTPEDIAQAYATGAAAYFLKPMDIQEYFSLIQMIAELWGKRAQLATGTN